MPDIHDTETAWIRVSAAHGILEPAYGITPRTVLRWANRGLIATRETPGGSLLYSEADCRRLAAAVDILPATG